MPIRISLAVLLITLLLLLMAPCHADTRPDSAQSIKFPPIDLSQDVSPSVVSPVLPMTEVEQKVLNYLEKGDSAEAERLVNSSIAHSKGTTESELLFLRAYLYFRSKNYSKAIRDLKKTLNENRATPSGTQRYWAFQSKCLGDSYYRAQHRKEALRQYQDALLLTKGLAQCDPLRVSILEPLTGCIVDKGDLAGAKTYGEQLLACCTRLARDGQLVNIGPLFSSEMELSQIYKRLEEKEKLQQVHASLLPLLDELMSLRNRLNASLSLSDRVRYPVRLKRALLAQYVSENQPQTLPEYLWLTSGFRFRSLPLISWEPAEPKPTAAILCVHGLGLENGAFEPFAAEMTTHNFAVYAMDVRGFGAWQSEYGSQSVNFARTLSDIHAIVNLIKERSPNLPIFLLGESMGGALVLRAAADFGGELTGVIASVPSAERYGEARMSLLVATHFLRHPTRPFDIGSQVVNQATSSEELRNLWEADPKAKEELSPIELIKFDRFMIVTEKKCHLIKSAPVLVVQGLADRLVKPKGTYEMFDNVDSKDKAMLIIGNAEHLIFETPHQSRVLLDGLTAWLNDHVQPR